MDVVFTANSPGELASWVRSTLVCAREVLPEARLVVALVPCPFASGAEPAYARSLPGVARVLSPAETIRFCCGLVVKGFLPEERGVVVFMGGEPWHARLLARRLGYPAVAYLERPGRSARAFQRVGVPHPEARQEALRRGVDPGQVKVVGNLTVESVRARAGEADPSRYGLERAGPVVGLFPGSRPVHVRAALPVFLAVAEEVTRRRPEVRFLLALSPFVRSGDLPEILTQPVPLGLPTTSARLKGEVLVTEAGLRVPVAAGRPYEVMGLMDVGLTIPGTNTAEMAWLGRPMLIVLNSRVPFPRGGLGGLLDRLPVGRGVKRRARWRAYRRLGFAGLPNRLAGRQVVPEIVAESALEEIAGPLVDLLDDPAGRKAMGEELRGLVTGSRTGAAEGMARLILEACGG